MIIPTVILVVLAASHGEAALPSWDPPAEDLNNHQLNEEIPTTEVIGVLYAIDTDGPDPVTYSIDDLSDDEVDENNGERDAFDYLEVDSTSGNVTAAQRIDYEVFTKMIARWIAYDGEGHRKSNVVTLYVRNINDNIPVFQNDPPYITSVREDAAIATSVYQAHATDADGDDIIYFMGNDSNCESEAFTIDGSSGVVAVNQALDYSKNVQYIMCLNAKDASSLEPYGHSHRTDETLLLRISVEDVQNRPPIFIDQPYDNRVSEDIPLGTVVENVTALDGDRGVESPNEIIYSLIIEETHPANGLFSIDSEGLIRVTNPLDRETDPITEMYTIVVEAMENDTSQPLSQISTRAHVYIRIDDIDDNKATFDPSGFVNATIPEEPPRGTPIDFGLQVYDMDSNEGGIIDLELVGNEGTFYLAMDTIYNSGVVDVRVENSSALDFERIESITFQIKGMNGSDSSIYTVVNATVYLTDINDNDPKFSQERYNVLMPENRLEGTYVTQITATDEDCMAELTYEILGVNQDWFVVDSEGNVVTSGSADFDAELLNVYFLTCLVSDGERVSTALLNVNITDLNDNAPKFQLDHYEVSILHDSDEKDILQVIAIDRDKDLQNRMLTYSIVSGNEDGQIDINEYNGSIFWNDISRNDEKDYLLDVMAIDSGIPPLNGTTRVSIYVVSPAIEDEVLNAAMIASYSLAGAMMLLVIFMLGSWNYSLRKYKQRMAAPSDAALERTKSWQRGNITERNPAYESEAYTDDEKKVN